jgi:hypothetical protein
MLWNTMIFFVKRSFANKIRIMFYIFVIVNVSGVICIRPFIKGVAVYQSTVLAFIIIDGMAA